MILEHDDPRPRRTSFRGFLGLAAIYLAALTVPLITVELWLGRWLDSSIAPAAAIVDHSFTYMQTLYEPHQSVTYVRDKHGLRGVREPLPRVEVVTVGGSTTDQRYITEGQTWQDIWRASTGLRVANAGVDGMSSSGHLVAVSEWLHRIAGLSPRAYLHYIGVNDAALIVEPSNRKYDRSGSDTWLSIIRKRSVVASALEQLWRQQVSAPIVAHGAMVLASSPPDMVRVDVDRDEIHRFIEQAYKPNLHRLLELHHQRGEIPIFVSQPAHPSLVRWKDGETLVASSHRSLDRFAVALGMINKATADICHDVPPPCRALDLASAVQFEASDFYDVVHYTPAGARKIGAFLAQRVPTISAGR